MEQIYAILVYPILYFATPVDVSTLFQSAKKQRQGIEPWSPVSSRTGIIYYWWCMCTATATARKISTTTLLMLLC